MLGKLFDEISTGTTFGTLAVLVLVPFVYYAAILAGFVRRVRKIGRAVDKFPGPTKHWLRGNLHQHPGPGPKGIKFFRGLFAKYGPVVRFWFGPMRAVVFVAHPDPIKTVLRSTEPKQTNMAAYGFLRSWLGDGLLIASGRKWLRNRRLLTPAFHFDVLRPYVKISNEAAGIFLDKLAAATKSGESVEISKPVCLCTLNVILRCAFSYDEDVQTEGESHPYVNAVLKMSKLINNRFFHPHQYFDTVYSMTHNGKEYQQMVNHVHKVSTEITAARQKTLRETPDMVQKKKCPDFLDILLLAKDEEGKGLTAAEIRDEVDTFLFEGHDTTASAISWILYELARHPELQEECRHEVDRLMEGRDSSDILWDDLQEIPYLTMCIKEAMRLNTPVHTIGRQTSKEFELEGVTLPKGTPISVSIIQMHISKAVWGDDALEFKPERFHPDRMKNMDPYAYVPFAAGPRNCIGQNFAMHEIKVIVARAVHRFELRLDTNHRVDHVPEIVMRAKNGIKLFLKPRAM